MTAASNRVRPSPMSTDSGTRTGPAAYAQSIDGCLDGAIGAHGLAASELARWLDRLAPAVAALQEDYRTRRLPHLRIAEATADLEEAQAALERLSRGADTLVFFGIGGSSLGGQTLAQLGGWHIPGMADAAQRRRPRTRFYDNLDPVTLQAALGSFDLAATRFIVISKSGGTPETLVQALSALGAVKAAGLERRIPELFLGITEPAAPGKANGLRTLFAGHGIPILDHDPGIGGRYSVLTNVGLLPAMSRGLDARAVRGGAREVIDALMAAERPADFAPAEGTAPIACLGPVDQHSQLQLFMDGPREYLMTVVRAPTTGLGPRIAPELAASAGLDYLAGRTAGDLVAAQAVAVPEALKQAGRPVRAFDLARLDEHCVGAL